MQLKELSKKINSKVLNESLAKNFGSRLNLESFNDGQLYDVRNKLRTEVSQMELSESYDSIIENTKYQKTKALLDVINEAILEREETNNTNIPLPETQVRPEAIHSAIRHRAENLSVPESWINHAIKRMQLGESDKAELSAELSIRYDLNEAQANWVLLENEEDKAENILSTKDMVSKVTNWIEDTAAMKSDQLIELIDSITKFQDSQVSAQFKEVVGQALEALYNSLVTCREGLSKGLSIVSGDNVETMGDTQPNPAGPPIPPIDDVTDTQNNITGLPNTDDNSTNSEMGRLQRENIEYSRKLALMLSEQKKK